MKKSNNTVINYQWHKVIKGSNTYGTLNDY